MLHIIHNRENKVRSERLNYELNQQGITKFTIVDAEMAPEGTEHEERTKYILKSHKKALAEGIFYNQGLKVNPGYVLIAEDDIRMPSIDAYNYFLEGMKLIPDDWDIYLGGAYTIAGMVQKEGYSKIINFFAGLQLYAVREKFYDAYLNCDHVFHDTALTSRCGAKTYVVNPFAAIQYNGFSDQRKMEVNDDHHLKDFQIRGL